MSSEDRTIPSTLSSRLVNFNNTDILYNSNINNNNNFSINSIVRKDTMLASSLSSAISNGIINPLSTSPNNNNSNGNNSHDDSISSNNNNTIANNNNNSNTINSIGNNNNINNTPNKTISSNNNSKTPKTMRFEVNLKSLKGEVDYKELVKSFIQDQNKEKINSSFYGAAPSNDLRESFEIEKELNTLSNPKNRLTSLIDRIERINTLGANINYVESDGDIESEDMYDENDSFIDDSQVIDFDEELETNYGGFFVIEGDVEHKEKTFIDYDDDDDDYEIDMMANSKSNVGNSGFGSNSKYGNGFGTSSNSATGASSAISSSLTANSSSTLKKRKHIEDQSSANKKIKTSVKLLDPSSPEIESLLSQLEEEIKSFHSQNLDLKVLPKKCGPLLAKLYERLRRTNSAGFIPSSILNRLATLWGIKEKTIKGHLKKAWEENDQKTQTKSKKSIEKLNELILDFRTNVEKEFSDQIKSNGGSKTVIGSDNIEKPLEYVWSRDSRQKVFDIVKLNKEIIDLKNSTEVIDAEKNGRSPKLIIEKTSRIKLYKQIVNFLPDTGITSKSLSTAYTTIRSTERKKERKLEEAQLQQQQPQQPQTQQQPLQLNTTTTTTTSSNSNSNSNLNSSTNSSSSNKERSSERTKDYHHSSISSHRSGDRKDRSDRDKDRSDRGERSERDKERSDREHHKSSSNNEHHRSSSSSGDKEKRREREKEKEKDRSERGERSDRDKERSERSDRDKEKSKDRSERKSSSGSSISSSKKEHSSSHNSSSGSSSNKEHGSGSSSSKESEKDRERRKEREREKERERRKEREKEREKDKEKDKKIKDVDLDIIHDMNSYKKKSSSSNGTTTTTAASSSPPSTTILSNSPKH